MKKFNPYAVTDKVTFQNVDKELTLYIRSDAATLVLGLKNVQDRLTAIRDDSPEEDRKAAALLFADTLFGYDQGAKLVDFYGDPLAVITVCGMYFKDRLAKIITKAQKR